MKNIAIVLYIIVLCLAQVKSIEVQGVYNLTNNINLQTFGYQIASLGDYAFFTNSNNQFVKMSISDLQLVGVINITADSIAFFNNSVGVFVSQICNQTIECISVIYTFDPSSFTVINQPVVYEGNKSFISPVWTRPNAPDSTIYAYEYSSLGGPLVSIVQVDVLTGSVINSTVLCLAHLSPKSQTDPVAMQFVDDLSNEKSPGLFVVQCYGANENNTLQVFDVESWTLKRQIYIGNGWELPVITNDIVGYYYVNGKTGYDELVAYSVNKDIIVSHIVVASESKNSTRFGADTIVGDGNGNIYLITFYTVDDDVYASSVTLVTYDPVTQSLTDNGTFLSKEYFFGNVDASCFISNSTFYVWADYSLEMDPMTRTDLFLFGKS